MVQRKIYLHIDGDGIVTTVTDDHRPPGMADSGGAQGDHLTPFTVLQDQIVNAIEFSSLEHAWVNLESTYGVYRTLPGWPSTAKWVREGYTQRLDKAFVARGDIDDLQAAVTLMLELRNRVGLTSVPKGGGGHAEAKWAGGLQHQERQFQLGHAPKPDRGDVIGYMWMAFEHGRVEQMGDEKRALVVRQHAVNVTDAYPQLCGALKLGADEVEAAYVKKDWSTWTPKYG